MMSTQQNTIVVGATGAGKTTSHQELLALCLRRVPDRFIVGEVTNPEALRGLFNLPEAVLMLRDEIGQLRIKGYEWDEIASMLKDDGQGGEGIDIDGPALWSILTTSLHQHSVPWPRAS